MAPVPSRTRESKRFRKEEFAVDFVAVTATCGACPLRAKCCDSGKASRRLQLHPHEDGLRATRTAWEQPALRTEYRDRFRFERLNHQITRPGARQARSFGLAAANLQAHMIAMRRVGGGYSASRRNIAPTRRSFACCSAAVGCPQRSSAAQVSA
ncbi:MAG: hypothetical protein EXR71_17530, partial [Myxococcales bacterium]|nr:hypothetical protein [Myxococcales bacterium]